MMLHNSPPLHELPQGFSCVRQVLYRERFPASDQVPAQIQKTTRKARQTRGSVGVREVALKEPPAPSLPSLPHPTTLERASYQYRFGRRHFRSKTEQSSASRSQSVARSSPKRGPIDFRPTP